MNECVNLRNIYSRFNTCTKQDIEQLRNIKRIDSEYDKYQNEGRCFLEDIFENNKLEYVRVKNRYSDGNIVGNMTISQNVGNLRYMCIYQEKAKYDINLDVSKELPAKMSVYDIKTNEKQMPDPYGIFFIDGHDDPDNILFGAITGPDTTVKALESRLIHHLNRNE